MTKKIEVSYTDYLPHTLKALKTDGLLLTTTRKDESVLCVFNFSLEEVSWSPADAADWSTVISANVAPAPEPGQDQAPLPRSLAPESGYIAICG